VNGGQADRGEGDIGGGDAGAAGGVGVQLYYAWVVALIVIALVGLDAMVHDGGILQSMTPYSPRPIAISNPLPLWTEPNHLLTTRTTPLGV